MAKLGYWVLGAIAVAFGLAILVALQGGSAGQFPAAVILLFVGVIGLVGMLLFVGVVLKLNHLSWHPFAFGLPNGSVRAFLAVLLIGLVGVFGTFVFFGVGPDRKLETYPVTIPWPVNEAALQARLGPDIRILAIGPERKVGDSSVADVKLATFVTSTGQLDIAKQLVTIIATVLTTVIGFYYGSRSAEGRDSAESPEAISRSAMEITAAYLSLKNGKRAAEIDATADDVEKGVAQIGDQATKTAAATALTKLRNDAQVALSAIAAAFDVYERRPDDGKALAAERDKVAQAKKKLQEIDDKLAAAKSKPESLVA